MRGCFLALSLVLICAVAGAQTEQPELKKRPPKPQSADQQSSDPNSSSSRSTKTDTSAPVGDRGDHPNSDVSGLVGETEETHAWNPHRADKDVEVGDYHFKRKNYHAAEDRYREALHFQDNNVAAMFGLAETLEKEARKDEAITYYTKYLKTMPNGPRAADVKKALQRLGAPIPQVSENAAPPPPPTELYEKKSLKERAKDAAPTSVCVGSLCTPKPAPGDPKPQPPDSPPQPK